MIKIISSNEMNECICGTITDRKMIWVFEGDEICKQIPLCCYCEESLNKNLYNELKSYTEVKKVIVYDNGISEIHYKDGQDMLVNDVTYSDAYLTGWEDEDCFIKR